MMVRVCPLAFLCGMVVYCSLDGRFYYRNPSPSSSFLPFGSPPTVYFQMHLSLFLFIIFVSSAAHKILVYNVKYAHSHSNFLGNVADLLVDAGNDVVGCIYSYFERLTTLKSKKKTQILMLVIT